MEHYHIVLDKEGNVVECKNIFNFALSTLNRVTKREYYDGDFEAEGIFGAIERARQVLKDGKEIDIPPAKAY